MLHYYSIPRAVGVAFWAVRNKERHLEEVGHWADVVGTRAFPRILHAFSCLRGAEPALVINTRRAEDCGSTEWMVCVHDGTPTQLMRTYFGRPEFGSSTRQKAYIIFPLLSSSTNSSSPPSEKKEPRGKDNWRECVTLGRRVTGDGIV